MNGDRLEAVAGAGVKVAPPLRVDDERELVWDQSADVVVVGFGGAGAATALEAHERGASVLVIERFEGGGATAASGGVYYAGGGTPWQKDAGVADTAEDMLAYLKLEHKDAVSPATLRRFCEDSVADAEWINRHGVPFEGSLYASKTNMPPPGHFLYYAGNEKVPSYAAHAKPAARGHKVKGDGWTGFAFFAGLKDAVTRAGIPVRTHCRVDRLVLDRNDRVIGVEILELTDPAARARHMELYAIVNPLQPFIAAKAAEAIAEIEALEQAQGQRKLVRAHGGVVLATGGFAYNPAMLDQHMPAIGQRVEALIRLGSAGCNGSGIQLGASAGGQYGRMERSFLGKMIAPPNALVEGIIVNRQGERFVNEDAYNALLGGAILEQTDAEAWIILDAALHRKLLTQFIPRRDGNFQPYILPVILNRFLGGTKKARTIARLAEKIGVPADALERTVAEANAAIANGQPDPAGKNPDYVRPIGKGPYRALNTAVGNKYSFCMFFTLGGLRVDEERGLVLRADGSAIPGLYAAGRAAMGIPSDGYISGLSLADCVFSGRRAGRDAAASRAASPAAA